MTDLDPRQDRTALRLRLYENGFTPLPNHFKACFLPEWTKVEVTPALIQSREWARSRAWSDTGVRCGDVIAIDWDVNDAALLNALLDEVIAAGLIAESPYVRVGKPPRELWVYRTSDKIGKRTTGAFMRGEDEEEKVEILGAGCQFGAYGQRDEDRAYQWPDQSLLNARYMDLPEITLAQVEALKDFAIAFFERQGLERKSPMAGTDGGYTHVYDLTGDMVFDVKDVGEMSVVEIDAYLQAAPDETVLRCAVDALRPTSGSWAGMASLVGGVVCISDHGTYEAHFPEEADDSAAVSRLGALLAPRIEQAEAQAKAPLPTLTTTDLEDLDAHDLFDVNMVRALKRFVFVRRDSQIYDIGRNSMPWFTTKGFREWATQFYTVKSGPRGGEIVTWLNDQWGMHPDRVVVDRAEMRPDQPRPLFKDGTDTVLNTYCPPVHDARTGDATVGVEMLRRLLPIPAELRYFQQWLRHKIENPHAPGTAIVMIAHETYGTGRGTLFQILDKVFGTQYVSNISFNTLTGKNSQSQYNEWLVDSLLVTVNEAQESGAVSRWQSRNDAYHHLKEIIDPSARKVSVLRKSIKNMQGISYASFIIASNHGDALVIPADDRRLAVLENGTSQPPEYWTAVRAWMEKPANIAAWVETILQADMTGFNAYAVPMMTRAKADMIDAGSSDLDRALKEVLAAMPGVLVVKEQVILALEDYLHHNAVEFPDGWTKVAEIAFRRVSKKLLGEDRFTFEGKQRNVRSIGPVTLEMLSDPAMLRAEVEKNGPLSHSLKTGGKVVSFPQR